MTAFWSRAPRKIEISPGLQYDGEAVGRGHDGRARA